MNQRVLLYVEDEDAAVFLLETALKEAEIDVALYRVADGDEAMAFLKTGSPIDLVFFDIQMPGSMDGVELARRIRVEYPSLPVILSSAHPRPETAAPFIAKPYRVERVISTISQTLRLK